MRHIVFRRHQLFLQEGQHIFMRGRIVWPQVIGLLHQPPAEDPCPHAVHRGAGKPGIIRADRPVGEDHARILVWRDADRGAAGEGRLNGSWGRGIEVNDLLFPFRRALESHAGEEGRQLFPLLRRPCVHAGPHECERHG